jgi:tRNA(Ile)-lysidine synthase
MFCDFALLFLFFMQKENKKKRKAVKKVCLDDDSFFLYKINNAIIERNLLQPNQRILIAVSGGQDSICLLKSLYHLKKNWNFQLGIVHCDHRWDRSSKFQAIHVAYLAGSLQIDYHQGIAIDFVQKEGIARIWRYGLIQTVAISNNYTAIVTGHNASDRIETLIYNLIRGSGLHGLQSIRWKRFLNFSRFTQSAMCRNNDSFLCKEVTYIKTFERFSFHKKRKHLLLIRPLLETTRTEIRTLLNCWKFPSWPDKSNKELQISRNRIRHRLVPYIRIHYNPNIDQTLTRWAEIVQSETLYLEQLTHSLLSRMEITKKIYLTFLGTYWRTSMMLTSSSAARLRSYGPVGLPSLRGEPLAIGQRDLWHKESRGAKRHGYPLDGGQNMAFFQSVLHLDLLRSVPLAIQRRLLKLYIYKNTGQILRFQYVEQIRLSCLSRTTLSSNVKKRTFITPWIIFPKEIKLLVTKNYLFLFYKK